MRVPLRTQLIIAACMLAALGVYAWSSGYQLGEDIAVRENRAR